MPAIPRMIDANLNRAREALRVMEDAARFGLDDAALASALKTLRHELAEAGAELPTGWLEASRDAEGDVGRELTAPGERVRSGLDGVAAAAGGRLTEALRVIEEAAKTLPGGLAERIESIRYRAYDLDRHLRSRLGPAAAQWRVCVVLTEAACRRPWADVAAAAVEGGADCIQVREPALGGAALLRCVREVLQIARPAGVRVVVNDRADVAVAAGADGVHVGQSDLAVADVRRIAGRTLLVGASTHDLAEAAAAASAGADYCGVGSMFPTSTKKGAAVAGPSYLAAFLQRFPRMPHLAIGGITPANVGTLVEAGARGVAVCAAVCGAADPGAAVAGLRSVLDPAAPRERAGCGR